MYAKNQSSAPKVDFPYQTQRQDAGELVVSSNTSYEKLTSEQIESIETDIRRSLQKEPN